MDFFTKGLEADFARFFEEDGIKVNAFYWNELPHQKVECQLKIKTDLILCGLPYLVGSFNFLGANLDYEFFKKHEGKRFFKGEEIKFLLPFAIALTAERVALNLLAHGSAIATSTEAFVNLAKPYGIRILDTRKTTPGLRSLEKYAVRIGGGFNHRFQTTDVFMIKDNHKTFFGGLKPALDFFLKLQAQYQPIVVEIHSLLELKEAIALEIKHIMLDNFRKEEIQQAILLKKPGMTYEISGGVTLENCKNFLIKGIDAISVGALTKSPPSVDLSMKISNMVLGNNKDSHEF